MANEIFDTLIIGGGPAGLSAAKHLAFHRLCVLLVDRKTGALNFLHNPVHNYLGSPSSQTGQALLRQFQGEAVAMGAQISYENIIRIEGTYPEFLVTAQSLKPDQPPRQYKAKTILLATGVSIFHPKINGNWEEWLPIASAARVCYYCADCEGPFVIQKKILVIGVGTVNNAIQTAKFLRHYASEILLFMTQDGFIPLPPDYQKTLDASGFRWFSGYIKSAKIVSPGNRQLITDDADRQHACNAFFISTIRQPRTELARSIGIHLNEHGAIITDETGQTNIEGIWAAGDVRAIARQIAVAAGTGNWAALMIHRKLRSSKLESGKF
ncbi:NAD(P)/FAD-dependent oxidoreductase [candidate division KSB1 bacterium]|nr:NAD(P)/FAD-dependent oxidoreductase [candidate division KSB1 bacterium]